MAFIGCVGTMIYILRNKAITENLISELNKIAYGDGRFVYQVEIKEHKAKRSLAQNRMMHGWFNQISRECIESGIGIYTSKAWKIYLKDLFLGEVVIELPNNRFKVETKNTRDLNTKEMTEFLENIDNYAGSELNICLRRPDDYSFVMGMK